MADYYNSVYIYNYNHLNILLHNKNNIVNVLLNNYFNLKKKLKTSSNGNIINFNYNLNLFTILSTKLFINNFINKKYKLNLIKKQNRYIIKRKNRLIKWKNRLNLKKNRINKRKIFRSILSLKRIFVSFPKIKHTNNNILILINIFNKEKIYLKKKFTKLKLIILTKNFINKFNNNMYNIKSNNTLYLKKILLNILRTKTLNIFFKRNYLAKLYLNNFKFNNLNLIHLKNIIYNIYSKEINLNITNIKYIYLDNSLFVDSITKKLNNRKKKVLKVLKKGLKLVKLANINTNILLEINTFLKDNIKENKFVNFINNIEYKNIFISMKNIHLTGINLEAKGRLTRRMTASRSVYKLKSKGSLKNIWNFFYDIGTSLIRGIFKSNINYITSASKNRNGAYGISCTTSTN